MIILCSQQEHYIRLFINLPYIGNNYKPLIELMIIVNSMHKSKDKIKINSSI